MIPNYLLSISYVLGYWLGKCRINSGWICSFSRYLRFAALGSGSVKILLCSHNLIAWSWIISPCPRFSAGISSTHTHNLSPDYTKTYFLFTSSKFFYTGSSFPQWVICAFLSPSNPSSRRSALVEFSYLSVMSVCIVSFLQCKVRELLLRGWVLRPWKKSLRWMSLRRRNRKYSWHWLFSVKNLLKVNLWLYIWSNLVSTCSFQYFRGQPSCFYMTATVETSCRLHRQWRGSPSGLQPNAGFKASFCFRACGIAVHQYPRSHANQELASRNTLPTCNSHCNLSHQNLAVAGGK